MPSAGNQTDPNPTKTFYDRISGAYDLIADASEHTARERGLTLLAAVAGERILEIGHGTGHSLVALARSVRPTGRVFGLDISEGMTAVARKRAHDEGVENIVELSIGDARQLPYGDGQFDAAFSSFTIELFSDSDIPVVLAEIRRVLRPAGRLAVVAMSREERETVMTEAYVWMHRHFPHFVDCRPIAVPPLLERAKLKVVQSEKTSIWGLPVAIAIAKKPA